MPRVIKNKRPETTGQEGTVTMSKENVKAFMEKLATDKGLQAKVNDQARAAEAIIVPVAKEAGFDFTAEEFKAYTTEASEKVSASELDSVAGGGFCLFGIGHGYGGTACKGFLGVW